MSLELSNLRGGQAACCFTACCSKRPKLPRSPGEANATTSDAVREADHLDHLGRAGKAAIGMIHTERVPPSRHVVRFRQMALQHHLVEILMAICSTSHCRIAPVACDIARVALLYRVHPDAE